MSTFHYLNVTHSSEVVYFSWFDFGDNFDEARRVSQVAIVQSNSANVRRLVFVQVLDAACVEGA